jgi:hypothetical protein
MSSDCWSFDYDIEPEVVKYIAEVTKALGGRGTLTVEMHNECCGIGIDESGNHHSYHYGYGVKENGEPYSFGRTEVIFKG